MIGVYQPPALLRRADDFTGANGSLGPNWTAVDANPLVRVSNAAQAGTAGGANTTTVYRSRAAQPMLTPHHDVRWTLVTPTGAAGRSYLGDGGILRGTADLSTRVDVLVTNNSVVLITRPDNTVRINQSLGAGANFRATCVHTLYSIYVDGASTPVATWDDSTGVIPINANTVWTGIFAVGQKNIFGQALYGWALDNWSAEDWNV